MSGLVEGIAYLVVLSKDDTRERDRSVGSTFRCFLVATDHEVSVTERQQQGIDLYSQNSRPLQPKSTTSRHNSERNKSHQLSKQRSVTLDGIPLDRNN